MTNKIAISDVVYLIEKRLGLDGVKSCEYIYQVLENKARSKGNVFTSKYMSVDDLVVFRAEFLKMVDVHKLNPLDYTSFLEQTNQLLENGSRTIMHATTENKKVDPYIKFCVECS
jgi:hypothetical protein